MSNATPPKISNLKAHFTNRQKRFHKAGKPIELKLVDPANHIFYESWFGDVNDLVSWVKTTFPGASTRWEKNHQLILRLTPTVTMNYFPVTGTFGLTGPPIERAQHALIVDNWLELTSTTVSHSPSRSLPMLDDTNYGMRPTRSTSITNIRPEATNMTRAMTRGQARSITKSASIPVQLLNSANLIKRSLSDTMGPTSSNSPKKSAAVTRVSNARSMKAGLSAEAPAMVKAPTGQKGTLRVIKLQAQPTPFPTSNETIDLESAEDTEDGSSEEPIVETIKGGQSHPHPFYDISTSLFHKTFNQRMNTKLKAHAQWNLRLTILPALWFQLTDRIINKRDDTEHTNWMNNYAKNNLNSFSKTEQKWFTSNIPKWFIAIHNAYADYTFYDETINEPINQQKINQQNDQMLLNDADKVKVLEAQVAVLAKRLDNMEGSVVEAASNSTDALNASKKTAETVKSLMTAQADTEAGNSTLRQAVTDHISHPADKAHNGGRSEATSQDSSARQPAIPSKPKNTEAILTATLRKEMTKVAGDVASVKTNMSMIDMSYKHLHGKVDKVNTKLTALSSSLKGDVTVLREDFEKDIDGLQDSIKQAKISSKNTKMAVEDSVSEQKEQAGTIITMDEKIASLAAKLRTQKRKEITASPPTPPRQRLILGNASPFKRQKGPFEMLEEPFNPNDIACIESRPAQPEQESNERGARHERDERKREEQDERGARQAREERKRGEQDERGARPARDERKHEEQDERGARQARDDRNRVEQDERGGRQARDERKREEQDERGRNWGDLSEDESSSDLDVDALTMENDPPQLQATGALKRQLSIPEKNILRLNIQSLIPGGSDKMILARNDLRESTIGSIESNSFILSRFCKIVTKIIKHSLKGPDKPYITAIMIINKSFNKGIVKPERRHRARNDRH
jgi:hypothetical protein